MPFWSAHEAAAAMLWIPQYSAVKYRFCYFFIAVECKTTHEIIRVVSSCWSDSLIKSMYKCELLLEMAKIIEQFILLSICEKCYLIIALHTEVRGHGRTQQCAWSREGVNVFLKDISEK